MKNYRDILAEDLAKRAELGKALSLRKLATMIGTSPSFISMVMSKKRNLTESSAQEICKVLKWDHYKSNLFVDLVRFENTGNEALQASLLERLAINPQIQEYEQLKHEVFCAISQWHHQAIIGLFGLSDFQVSVDNVVKKLHISPIEAENALDRLLRLRMIERNANGELRLIASNFSYGGDAPAEAIRKYHKQMLKKAAMAIDEQPMNERDFAGFTVVTDPQLLIEAQAMIKEFRRNLAAFLHAGKKTAVYYFSSQLFRIDKKD